MSDLPAPLTPVDCDLRGFEWMALHGHRLFTSGWYGAAMKDPRGGLAALKLWWAAMLQCPAGSLPNDEDDLCLLADFGQDARAWKKHRAVAMRGFVLCSDNRYYHPMVAEQALKAYEGRLKAAKTRLGDAERLRRWRAGNGSHPPEKPNGQAPPEPPLETPNETRFKPRFETPLETRSETAPETGTKRDRPYSTGTAREEKKVSVFSNLPSSSAVLARVAAACETPPVGTFGADSEQETDAPDEKPVSNALQIATQNLVGKLARKLESSGKTPIGKRPQLTVIEQQDYVLHGEVVEDDDRPDGWMPRRPGPLDPVRSREQQYAELLGISLAEASAALGHPQTLEHAP